MPEIYGPFADSEARKRNTRRDGVAAGASDERVRTFTIAFDDADLDESGRARAVADHLGTDHHELTATEGATLAMVERLGRAYDEPFGDSSALPTLLLAQLARNEVTVALTRDNERWLLAQADAPSARPHGVLLHGRDLHANHTLDNMARRVSIAAQPVQSMESLLAALDAAGMRRLAGDARPRASRTSG